MQLSVHTQRDSEKREIDNHAKDDRQLTKSQPSKIKVSYIEDLNGIWVTRRYLVLQRL